MSTRSLALTSLVLLLLFSSGCRRSGEELTAICQGWIGAHKSDIIAEWGPPLRSVDDGRGGEVLTWERDFGTESYRLLGSNTDVQRFERFHFWINKQGNIYSYRWEKR